MQARLNLILSSLIILLPLALLTGPFIPDLFASVSALIFLFILIKYNETKYLKNIYFYLGILFIAYLIVSTINSEFILFSLKSTSFYFRFLLLSLAVWYVLDNQKNFIKYFTISLIISFFLAIIAGIYQLYFGQNFIGIETPDARLLLIASDQALLGNYLSRLFPLLVGLIILNFNNKKMYFLIITIFISIDVITLLSGERTAIMLLLVSSLFILIFVKQFRLIRLLSFFVSISILIFITIFSTSIMERNINQTINQLGLEKDSNQLNIFSPEHDRLYKVGLKIFTDYPILGVGPNNFRNVCQKEKYAYFIDGNNVSCSTHPHHIYVQILSETGLLGAIFLFTFIIYLFVITGKQAYTMARSQYSTLSDFQICLIAFFICTIFPFVPSLNLFNNWINIIYFTPVGFYLYSIYSLKNN